MSQKIPVRYLTTVVSLRRPEEVIVDGDTSNIPVKLGNFSVRITSAKSLNQENLSGFGKNATSSYLIFANFDGDTNPLELLPDSGDWIMVNAYEVYEVVDVDIRPGGVENHHMEIYANKSDIIILDIES